MSMRGAPLPVSTHVGQGKMSQKHVGAASSDRPSKRGDFSETVRTIAALLNIFVLTSFFVICMLLISGPGNDLRLKVSTSTCDPIRRGDSTY